MKDVVEATGESRDALLKALTEESVPRFDTVLQVLKALDIGLLAFPNSDVPRVAHESPLLSTGGPPNSPGKADDMKRIASGKKHLTNEEVRAAIEVLLSNGYALRA